MARYPPWANSENRRSRTLSLWESWVRHRIPINVHQILLLAFNASSRKLSANESTLLSRITTAYYHITWSVYAYRETAQITRLTGVSERFAGLVTARNTHFFEREIIQRCTKRIIYARIEPNALSVTILLLQASFTARFKQIGIQLYNKI